MKTFAFAALLAASSYAAYDSCKAEDYEVAIQSFMQGFQYDVTATDTECYAKTTTLTGKIKDLVTTANNFDSADWAAPLYQFSEFSVASTELFTYCQTTNFAKQLAVRANSFAGLFDLTATVGVAYLKQYRGEEMA